MIAIRNKKIPNIFHGRLSPVVSNMGGGDRTIQEKHPLAVSPGLYLSP